MFTNTLQRIHFKLLLKDASCKKKYVLSRAQMHERNKNILWALFNIPIHFNSQPNNRMDGLALHEHIVKYQELYSVKHDNPAEWNGTMQLKNYLGFHPWKLRTDKIHWKDSNCFVNLIALQCFRLGSRFNPLANEILKKIRKMFI